MALPLDRLSPTRLQVTRAFAAPPERVWQAHVDPEIIPRWLTGPDGWVMTICHMNMTPGGQMHYRWEQTDGAGGFELTAEVQEVDAPHLIRHVEVMHLPDPTPPNRVETRITAQGSGSVVTLIMQVDDAATMDGMIAHGMADGMEMSYSRLDALLSA